MGVATVNQTVNKQGPPVHVQRMAVGVVMQWAAVALIVKGILMLIDGLYSLFFLLIYTPKKYRTCENGWHEFGPWRSCMIIYQARYCKKCNKEELSCS